MKELTIRGNTTEEKFLSTEVILRRLGRRMPSEIVGIMPVSFVFNTIYRPTSKGLISKMIFPASGTITKGHISLNAKGPINLVLDIINTATKRTSTQEYRVKRGNTEVILNFTVVAGDRVTISAFPAQAEKEGDGVYIEEILFGALYEINYKDLNGAKFLIENAEEIIENKMNSLGDSKDE